MGTINAEVNGLKELNAELDRRFSGTALSTIVDKALAAGARVIKSEIETNFESFADTGASKDEITLSNPMTLNNVRTVVIYWSGSKNRYTIIHLNEFGTIKNPNPRGKGAIERAMRAGQAKYFQVVKQEIARAVQ